MTENEKQEAFDKWYDENYDEWAEGEEGIALREELEQAFKSGIAELEKENAELKQAEKDKVVEHFEAYGQCRDSRRIADLEKENAELKEEMNAKQVVLNDFKSRVETVTDRFNKKSSQLTKAKEIIRDFLLMAEVEHLKDRYETVDEAEQFLSEVKN